MFSLILLNYKRPQNVQKIVDAMKDFACINEIIISNGDVANSINYIDEKVKIYDDYNDLNGVYSLELRFICGLRATNENIIIMDDDVYIVEDEFNKLVAEYHRNPNRIVGYFGRNIDKGYNGENAVGDVDIVLTRLLVCQKKLCSLFFICKPMIEHIYKKGEPYGNGEDIFFSFIGSIYYKRKHVCLDNIRIVNLPQNDAISARKNHYVYRNELATYLVNNSSIFHKFIGMLLI